MFDPDQEMMDFLILNGAIEISGFDKDSEEFLYTFTPKMKEMFPDLYREHLNLVNENVMMLWEKGFVNVDLFAEEPLVTLTEQALDEEAIQKLTENERWSLEEIKRILKNKL